MGFKPLQLDSLPEPPSRLNEEHEPCPPFEPCPLNEPCPPKEPATLNEVPAIASGSSASRFKFATEKELDHLSKGVEVKNTNRSTQWAFKTFNSWCDARNDDRRAESVPTDLLSSPDILKLNKYLSMFIVEARKANGENYPPATLHVILCGILRHMREFTPDCPNFLDKGDRRFEKLHGTLDAHFHDLHSRGIGRQVHHAEVITVEEEDQLWDSGVCGLNNPVALQNAAFYVVGKMFCLRGGVEHRELKLSQLNRLSGPERYIYIENVSKTRNGSFKQLHLKNKEVPIYACPEVGERCPVYILDKYISKLPPNNNLFYLRPLDKTPKSDEQPWYSAVPVGKNTLAGKIKKMCQLANVGGNKTNHSLRATGATSLYEKGVPEKIIQERTGHRSLEALRVYEHTNAEQHLAVSRMLSGRQTHYMTPYDHPTMYPTMNLQQPQIHKVSHVSTSTSNQNLGSYPGIHFGVMNGCTFNINSPAVHGSSSSTYKDDEIDELFRHYQEF